MKFRNLLFYNLLLLLFFGCYWQVDLLQYLFILLTAAALGCDASTRFERHAQRVLLNKPYHYGRVQTAVAVDAHNTGVVFTVVVLSFMDYLHGLLLWCARD